MCGWLITSDSQPLHDPADLIAGLRRQPLLAVLRPGSLLQARTQLQLLQGAGLSHVELAVQASAAWVSMVEELRLAFPRLRLGAASVRDARQLQAVQAAGLRYAVSPILVPSLLEQARSAAVTLVPGVFSPTEIAQAVDLGAPAVKLFPAATLGPGYWASLSGPLGPLPFCLAAGGLTPADVPRWLSAGVDAVALGNCLFSLAAVGAEGSASARLHPDLEPLLAQLGSRAIGEELST
jgi:2-dehydro-3-deoxyphosphogluconate aldolase / (4S)-4-hydroxy-2-oxoglutarate aldolase